MSTKAAWNKGKTFAFAPRKKQTEIACPQCGTIRVFQPWEVKKNARFCSLKCKVAASNRGLSSANELLRKSAAYKSWRLAVFERDDYTCQECLQRGGELNADHIKPFAFFQEGRFDTGNGRTLCIQCHRKTDTFGVKAWRNSTLTENCNVQV